MRNTSSLYYPFVESILSILPIVDEFVIALGDNDPDDKTEECLNKIKSDKIKWIHTKWDLQKYAQGSVYAQQSDLAKKACSGDWLFYLQSDEVVHEKYLTEIVKACKDNLLNETVEGLLFHYKHFWGDYEHYIKSHCWYPNEIRIVRNKKDIHSYGDAQSFKVIKDFDELDYRTSNNIRKLKVKLLDAEIYHYGWVRPPEKMQSKSKQMDGHYHEKEKIEEIYRKKQKQFDYGNLSMYSVFKESHPKVMKEFIEKMDWHDQLHYEKNYIPVREPLKHERWKYRALSWLEQQFFNGRPLFGYRNWNVVK